MQCSHIESLLTFHFGKRCIEVPLKRSFIAQGTEKMVPVSESPSYPGSHLCEVFLLRKGGKMRGPRKTVLLSESPSYPGSHLTGVNCTRNLTFKKSTEIQKTSFDEFQVNLILINSVHRI